LADLQKLLQDQIDRKANASDVLADHYTKDEVDALIKAAQTTNNRVFMPFVASDGNWHAKLVQINPDGTLTDVPADATHPEAGK
jgi:IMP cyclohydrolase